MRRYEHLVFQFWEHHPGEKAKLMVQATGLLWNPRVRTEGAPERGVDSLRPGSSRSTRAALPPRTRRALLRRRRAFGALALIFLLYNTLAAWSSPATTRYRVPSTSCSRCSPQQRSTACSTGGDTRARRRRPQRPRRTERAHGAAPLLRRRARAPGHARATRSLSSIRSVVAELSTPVAAAFSSAMHSLIGLDPDGKPSPRR